MSTIAVDNARPSAGGTSFSLTSGVAKVTYQYDQNVPEIDASENVSSISDDTTGQHTVNITNSFSAATFSTPLSLHSSGTTANSDRAAAGLDIGGAGKSTSLMEVGTTSANSAADYEAACGAYFGDLA